MENKYKHKQLIVRMKYNTFLRLKKLFPATHKESMTSYFERLAKYLENLDAISLWKL